MSKEYREAVIRTLEVLDNSHGYMFAELLNLASTGEMKEVMSVFVEGDSYDFKLEHFDDLEDDNIKKLIHLLRQVETTYRQIKKNNNILSEEIFPEDSGENPFNEDDELPF